MHSVGCVVDTPDMVQIEMLDDGTIRDTERPRLKKRPPEQQALPSRGTNFWYCQRIYIVNTKQLPVSSQWPISIITMSLSSHVHHRTDLFILNTENPDNKAYTGQKIPSLGTAATVVPCCTAPEI